MSEPYDRLRAEHERDDPSAEAAVDVETGTVLPATEPGGLDADELEEAREDVFSGWPSSEDVGVFVRAPVEAPPDDESSFEPQPEPFATPPEPEPEDEPRRPEPHDTAEDHVGAGEAADLEAGDVEVGDVEAGAVEAGEPAPLVGLVEPEAPSHEHAPGALDVPPGYGVLEGTPDGTRRAVGVVVSRFNGDVTSRLLTSALAELERAGVAQEAVTVMPVPGAFELPIGAMALARTRRFACVVALGCVVRGDTPHFDYVAAEAASGLQLAALETGVPVSFGVLTLDRADQAESRIEKGAEAARTALEMADLFSHLRAAAAR